MGGGGGGGGTKFGGKQRGGETKEGDGRRSDQISCYYPHGATPLRGNKTFLPSLEVM